VTGRCLPDALAGAEPGWRDTGSAEAPAFDNEMAGGGLNSIE